MIDRTAIIFNHNYRRRSCYHIVRGRPCMDHQPYPLLPPPCVHQTLSRQNDLFDILFGIVPAPPPIVIEIATKSPVTIVPISTPPGAAGPRSRPTRTGTTTGNRNGAIIFLIAAEVNISTALSYRGFAEPFIIPAISRNCRRTSKTTAPAARPTASMAMALNRQGTRPPTIRPIMAFGLERSNAVVKQVEISQNEIKNRDAQKPQPRNQHIGNGTTSERDIQCALHAI